MGTALLRRVGPIICVNDRYVRILALRRFLVCDPGRNASYPASGVGRGKSNTVFGGEASDMGSLILNDFSKP